MTQGWDNPEYRTSLLEIIELLKNVKVLHWQVVGTIGPIWSARETMSEANHLLFALTQGNIHPDVFARMGRRIRSARADLAYVVKECVQTNQYVDSYLSRDVFYGDQ